MLRICLLLLSAVLCTIAQYRPANDDLYILIDEVSVYSCRGVKNEIKLTEEDVNIVNEKGNKAYYIRAPGNYSLHFKNLEVKKEFGFLAGEIGITLQVPIIEGPAGMRFDIPYPIVPETGLLTQKCDEHSGIVERNGRQYCRYCDLCGVADSVEDGLNDGHTFLPKAEGDTRSNGQCGSVAADKYNFKRTISLPSRSYLERMVKDKMVGLDKEVTKRLNKGRGRFQVFLNLIAAAKPSMSQRMWFNSTPDCKCCSAKDPDQCGQNGYLYCNIEECKSSWAQQCLHNTARIAACFTVEFNYRMTTSYAEVLQFLRENNYPNQNVELPKPRSPPPYLAPKRTTPAPQVEVVEPVRPRRPLSEENADVHDTDNAADEATASERCVAMMPARLTHLRRYCTIFWNAKLCCTHCEGVCTAEE